MSLTNHCEYCDFYSSPEEAFGKDMASADDQQDGQHIVLSEYGCLNVDATYHGLVDEPVSISIYSDKPFKFCPYCGRRLRTQIKIVDKNHKVLKTITLPFEAKLLMEQLKCGWIEDWLGKKTDVIADKITQSLVQLKTDSKQFKDVDDKSKYSVSKLKELLQYILEELKKYPKKKVYVN